MLAMRSDHAALLEPMDQSLDCAPNDGHATRTVLASSRNDQNLSVAVASRELNLLLTQPRFASCDCFRRRRETISQV
jgi:hypothetical protein